MLSFCRIYALSILLSLAYAQLQFSQPNGSLADRSQTFVSGKSYTIQWYSGWKGYGPAPDGLNVDLFLVSFNSDAYIDLLITNVSLSTSNVYNWRVNIPEDTITAEQVFAFKFVTARNPPNYIAAQPGKVLSPSRGFKVALPNVAPSVTASETILASSSATPTPSSATASSAISSTPTSSPTSAPVNAPANDSGGSSTPIGAIVGGVVGGLAIIALGVVAWLLLRLMKRKKAQQNVVHESAPGYMPSEMGDTQYKTPATYYASSGTYPTSPAPQYTQAHVAPQEMSGNHMPVEADGNYQGRLAH